jgi:hypothetical protein
MERKMSMKKKEEDEKTTFILMWIIFLHATRYTADRALEKVSWGQILSPWLGDEVDFSIGLIKVDSGIGLPMVNVFESTLAST